MTKTLLSRVVSHPGSGRFFGHVRPAASIRSKEPESGCSDYRITRPIPTPERAASWCRHGRLLARRLEAP